MTNNACMFSSMLALALLPLYSAAADYADLPGGTMRSVLAGDATGGLVKVDRFSMRTTPVTRVEFARFLADHPEWQRGRASRVFADASYLADWPAPPALPSSQSQQPVTHVSWFAAQAFCESESARLPTWNEWEFAAAADDTRPDARDDPAWRARILSWYSRPATAALPAVGGAPNAYGVSNCLKSQDSAS